MDVPVFEVRLSSDELYLIGDLHVDAPTFNYNAFMKAVQIAKDKPVILLGDITDYGFKDDILSQLSRRTPSEIKDIIHARFLNATASVIKQFNNIVAVCLGNHDRRMGKYVGDVFLAYLAEELGFHYVPGQGLLMLYTGKKRNGRMRRYNIVITHGGRGGRRLSAPVNELEDLASRWSGVHVIAIGHHHKFVHTSISRYNIHANHVVKEVTELIAVPAFIGYEEYAQVRGYIPPEHAIVRLKFQPRSGRINVEKIVLE